MHAAGMGVSRWLGGKLGLTLRSCGRRSGNNTQPSGLRDDEGVVCRVVGASLPGWLVPCLLLALYCTPLFAQHRGSANLSESEVEEIREAAMDPPARVLAFQKIVETRIERIQRVLVDIRAQGRAADIHQNMDEVSGVVNELEDNLDEYASGHKDLRKVLPKLIAVTDRWASVLRQPPDNDRYNVTRKLALEAVADLKDDAQKLLPEQQAWFKAHPPSKEPPPTRYEVPTQ